MANPSWQGGGGGIFPSPNGQQILSIVSYPWGDDGSDNVVSVNFDFSVSAVNGGRTTTRDAYGNIYGSYLLDFSKAAGPRVLKRFKSLFVGFDFDPSFSGQTPYSPLLIAIGSTGQQIFCGNENLSPASAGAKITMSVPLLCSTDSKVLLSKRADKNEAGVASLRGAGNLLFCTFGISPFNSQCIM
jgi:hypothetical protein